ncbi:MAG: formylglycine-generating enzyme family protein, partial [Vicinamibacterales bacterium]
MRPFLAAALWCLLAPAQTPFSDDMALVREMHRRIIAAPAPETMAPYTATIPATGVTFDMAPIAGGEFVMGTPRTERGRRADEGPQRKVVIEPFWMGRREVTWDEYRLFMTAPDEKKDFV